MTESQQYCLRWNNHQSNLLAVFDELLQNEAFTDVTIACDGGSIKCHRMVLVACSPYFQNLFTELPCKHPVVVLKDVKYCEIKAILEYMYRGEVNVAQDQLAGLLQVAEALKVKGLVDANRPCKSPSRQEPPPIDQPPSIPPSDSIIPHPVHSGNRINSPPHSTNTLYKNPYNSYDRKSHSEHNTRMNLPIWAMPGLPLPPHTAAVPSQIHPHAAATAAAAMLSSAYEAVSSDMSPLKRKKLSSLLMQRDTPILRTVLGQGQTDSAQPVSLVCHSNSSELSGGEERMVKHMKNEPSEDAQSPYTDFTERMNDEEEKSKLAIPSSSPQSFSHDIRTSVTSGIATYVPSQKPEWKRYKQYTRDDIMSAIEAVKNGMSALQSARKYGVPSRTLYDKVKKMGITTSRPFKRGNNGSSACFPYSSGSPYGGHLSESEENINNNSALLQASTFLQHALDSRGGDEREALAAMAAAAAVHAVASGHSTSPNNLGQARSPSPSPTMLKYMRHNSLTPSPAPGSDHHHSDQTNGSSEREREEDEDQVEDLSVNRKQSIESRVIMPPMSQMSTVIKNEDMSIDNFKTGARREMRVEAETD